MPASTVNGLSTIQLAGLSTEQLTSLINSPNYPYYSSLITSNVETQINTAKITFATTTVTVASKVTGSSNLSVSIRFPLIYLILNTFIFLVIFVLE